MKKTSGLLVGLLILLALFNYSCKRTEKNRDIFDDFEGEEGIYMLKVPPALFLGMINAEIPENEDSNDLGKVDFVKILVFDQKVAGGKTTGEVSMRLGEKFSKYGYEIIIQVSSGGADVSAYMLENKDYVSDLMVVIREGESLTGIGLSGRLDLKAIENFTANVQYDDLKGLLDYI